MPQSRKWLDLLRVLFLFFLWCTMLFGVVTLNTIIILYTIPMVWITAAFIEAEAIVFGQLLLPLTVSTAICYMLFSLERHRLRMLKILDRPSP